MTTSSLSYNITPNQADTCKKNQTCSTCLDTANCGWCPDSSSCIPRSGTYRIVPDWVSSLRIWLPSQENGCKAATFIYSKNQCADVLCMDYKDCKSCAGVAKCGWAAGTSTCMSKEDFAALSPGSGSGSGSSGMGSGSGSAAASPGPLITASASCPAKACTDITDCTECTNATGCGFCKDSSKCVKLDQYGAANPSDCKQANVLTTPYTCPCSALTKCTDCAARSGCGFCGKTKKCVNLDKNGVANATECEAENIADSVGKCSPGPGLPAPVDHRTAPDPSATELSMVQTNDANFGVGIKPIDVQTNDVRSAGSGAGAVSPPKRYTAVSAPGVWRPLSQGNPQGGNATAIDASPLESYVKMLVNSQLAEQGIPTNEPFQVNEVSAIENASQYARASFKKIFG
jgi:hypothetical protein